MLVLQRALLVAWLGTLASLLGGCSGTLDNLADDYLPEKEAPYKSSKRLPPLEVPPDLSRSAISESLAVPQREGGTTYSQYQSREQNTDAVRDAGVLPSFSAIRVEREGDERWLVINAPPSDVWSRVFDFWLEQGFVIDIEDPSIGIMETDWAEKRADLRSGLVDNLLSQLSSALYGAAIRDKFRTRLERGARRDSTEVYISHRGAEEVGRKIGNSTKEAYEEKFWQPRPSDPELEAEMLSRLMVYMGVTQEQATESIAQAPRRPERAKIVREASGASVLAVDEDFSRAWRRTGLALDRVGFTVEDRDRSRGLYFVRYVDPDTYNQPEERGFLSSLKFWDSQETPEPTEYLVSLLGNETSTQIVVLDNQAQRDTSPTADRILSLLYEQLK